MGPVNGLINWWIDGSIDWLIDCFSPMDLEALIFCLGQSAVNQASAERSFKSMLMSKFSKPRASIHSTNLPSVPQSPVAESAMSARGERDRDRERERERDGGDYDQRERHDSGGGLQYGFHVDQSPDQLSSKPRSLRWSICSIDCLVDWLLNWLTFDCKLMFG